MNRSTDTEPGPDDLPPGLRQALQSASRRRIDVPLEIENAILENGRRHLRGIRERRPAILFVRTAALAAAACAVIAVGLTLLVGDRARFVPVELALSREDTGSPSVALEDVDGNGRVDILDAFTLAQRIEGSARRSAWDFNSDGAVDRRDVDLVAMAAVRLEEEVAR